MKAAIIIPTYNEAENISRLIPDLYANIFPGLTDWEIQVVIVDGNSPDGTGKIVRQLKDKFPSVHLINETEKSGIGAAYVKGFTCAMKTLEADVVVEFDADFQHPPETIPAILQKISDGYDYVLGSRRIAGGSEPVGRNIFRRFLTDFGGLLARLILFFPGKYFHIVTDPTTGLKATRVKGYLGRLDLRPEHLYSKKFGYKVQLLSETLALGARYAEIPLKFGNRLSGTSKFENDTTWDVLMACVKTRIWHKKGYK